MKYEIRHRFRKKSLHRLSKNIKMFRIQLENIEVQFEKTLLCLILRQSNSQQTIIKIQFDVLIFKKYLKTTNNKFYAFNQH
ncbi:CLUMA_CG003346, isoform A [Clunio marinus]|uniref:CLUMA_CG003346, isoform A n=1 Tax=Clunio marinus TaxID=568069 RepID=A0A1J1HSU8_9DIPT|nr:CLUMA_CG003346, isoform A [Clunio marinus]